MATLFTTDFETGSLESPLTQLSVNANQQMLVNTSSPLFGSYSAHPDPSKTTFDQSRAGLFLENALSPSLDPDGQYSLDCTFYLDTSLNGNVITFLEVMYQDYWDIFYSEVVSGGDLIVYDTNFNDTTLSGVVNPGTTQKFQVYLKLSTYNASGIPQADGAWKIWVDDVLVLDETGKLLYDDDSFDTNFPRPCVYNSIIWQPGGRIDNITVNDGGDGSIPPLSNDDCSSATTLSTFGGGAIFTSVGNAAGCTRDAADPVPSAASGPLNFTIWFKFTANTNTLTGTSTFRVRAREGGDAPIVGIFTGSCGDFTEVASGTPYADFEAEAGTTYYIMIGWEDGDTPGIFDLSGAYLVYPQDGCIGFTTDLQRITNAAFNGGPVISIGPSLGLGKITVRLNAVDATFWIRYSDSDGDPTDVFTPNEAGKTYKTGVFAGDTWIPSPMQTFELEFHFSTYDATNFPNPAAEEDGFWRFYLNGTLVYEVSGRVSCDGELMDCVQLAANGNGSSWYIRNTSNRLSGYGQVYPDPPTNGMFNVETELGLSQWFETPVTFPFRTDFDFPDDDPTLINYGNFSEVAEEDFFGSYGWETFTPGTIGTPARYEDEWISPLANGQGPQTLPEGPWTLLWAGQGGSVGHTGLNFILPPTNYEIPVPPGEIIIIGYPPPFERQLDKLWKLISFAAKIRMEETS